MVDKSREMYGRNCVETIIDSDGILWLNEKHKEEELKMHRNELVDEPKKHPTKCLYVKNYQLK